MVSVGEVRNVVDVSDERLGGGMGTITWAYLCGVRRRCFSTSLRTVDAIYHQVIVAKIRPIATENSRILSTNC